MHNSNLCGQSFSTANTHQSHQPTLHRQLQFASCQTSISVARRSFQYLNQEPGCFLASRIFFTAHYLLRSNFVHRFSPDRRSNRHLGNNPINFECEWRYPSTQAKEWGQEWWNWNRNLNEWSSDHQNQPHRRLWAYASPGGTNRSPLFHFLWSTWPGSAC